MKKFFRMTMLTLALCADRIGWWLSEGRKAA